MNEAEQEIDLHDYVLVLLKRKKLILSVFFISVCVTAAICFFSPKIYEISMIVEPGTLGVSESGKFTLIDSAENMKAMIAAGAFESKVIGALKLNSGEEKIALEQPQGSNFIKLGIKKKQSETELGKRILRQYFDELNNFYQKVIDAKQDSVDKQIAITNNTIKNQNNLIKLNETSLKITEEREKGLLSELQVIQANTDQLMAKRGSLLDKNNGADPISSLLVSSVIQQDISYFNNLNNQLVNIKTMKENIGSTIKTVQNTINDLEIEIEKLKSVKNGICNIGLVQEPRVSLRAIGPKRKQNIILAGIMSLMIGTFLAFVAERWERTKNR
jgi:capsular polysaccharide biosynthesis protein